MKRTAAIAVVMTVVSCTALLLWLPGRQGQTRPSHVTTTLTSPVFTHVVVSGDEAAGLGARMVRDDELAHEVIFLFVASLTARCTPERAHDLPRMAMAAGLPVLAAGAGGAQANVALRHAMGKAIHAATAQAPCRGAVTLTIGPFACTLEPLRYASAFPDSYFDTSLDVVPGEFASLSLAERAADPCNRVAYAVLPLNASRAWQCAGLRADTRNRVRAICHAQGPHAQAAAASIHVLLQRLPSTCA
ncbi:hypothetical protein [Dyella sp.]|uniref:hypothetical protein n=1 Tax=Dyella sp. TaxID=1869338 RepID=UPI002ED4C51A